MDVLQYWEPDVDPREFRGDGLSEHFSATLFDFVCLCHCVAHWMGQKRATRQQARANPKLGWNRAARSYENHEMRARHLAAEKAWKLAELADSAEELALTGQLFKRVGLIRSPTSHERANFATFAIDRLP